MTLFLLREGWRATHPGGRIHPTWRRRFRWDVTKRQTVGHAGLSAHGSPFRLTIRGSSDLSCSAHKCRDVSAATSTCCVCNEIRVMQASCFVGSASARMKRLTPLPPSVRSAPQCPKYTPCLKVRPRTFVPVSAPCRRCPMPGAIGRGGVADVASVLEVFRRHAPEARRLGLVEKRADELVGKDERLDDALGRTRSSGK